MNNLIDNTLVNEKGSLDDIFCNNNNISILKRQLSEDLSTSCEYFYKKNPNLAFSKIININSFKKKLNTEFESDKNISVLIYDIYEVVKKFCIIFETDKVWLRLDSIDRPMCPNFHTDDVKCRMVTTYLGPGTQWIPQHLIDKNMTKADIMQLNVGDIALLKGEGWKGNEGNGLIHRSPHSNTTYKRLYMTVDFVDFYYKLNINR